MSFRVWYPRSLGDELDETLRAALSEDVQLVTGEAAPPFPFEALVEGAPTREQLEASSALTKLVIPWAGLPAATRTLLGEYRHLGVFNLHHNAAPTAEYAVALLLAAVKRLVPADQALRHGDWSIRYEMAEGCLLEGNHALIVGYGHVGRRVGDVCRTLGMWVTGVRRTPDELAPDERGLEQLAEVLPDAHVLVLCLPSTPATRGLFGEAELALLPPGAVLVNVGRADVVDEAALFDALHTGAIGGAGLDVWYRYPESEAERTNTLPSAYPFHELDNVVLSPHRAGHCDRTQEMRAAHLADLLSALARGDAEQHRVDLDVGY